MESSGFTGDTKKLFNFLNLGDEHSTKCFRCIVLAWESCLQDVIPDPGFSETPLSGTIHISVDDLLNL